jgi:hypothetical protein
MRIRKVKLANGEEVKMAVLSKKEQKTLCKKNLELIKQQEKANG